MMSLTMEISKEATQKRKEIYYQEFGEAISDEEADDLATSLLELFKVIYRPIPDEQNDRGEATLCEASEDG